MQQDILIFWHTTFYTLCLGHTITFFRCSRNYGRGGNNTDKRPSPRSWLVLWRCLLFGAEQVGYDDFFKAFSPETAACCCWKQHGESWESEANTARELQSCWWLWGLSVTSFMWKKKNVPCTHLSWSDPLCFFHVKRQHLYNGLQTLLCLPLSLSEPVYNAWQKVINDSVISIYKVKKKKLHSRTGNQRLSVCPSLFLFHVWAFIWRK